MPIYNTGMHSTLRTMFNLINYGKIGIIQSSNKAVVTESLIRIVHRTRISDLLLCSLICHVRVLASREQKIKKMLSTL